MNTIVFNAQSSVWDDDKVRPVSVWDDFEIEPAPSVLESAALWDDFESEPAGKEVLAGLDLSEAKATGRSEATDRLLTYDFVTYDSVSKSSHGPEEENRPQAEEEDQLQFPDFDGMSLFDAQRVYRTHMPTPADVTPGIIEKTKMRTKEAGLMKIVMSHSLSTLNQALNRALYTVPETREMTDDEVRALPGFPSQDDLHDAVHDFLMNNGLRSEWFAYVYEQPTDGNEPVDYEDWRPFEFMADGITDRSARWSAESAWRYHDSARRGGAAGRKSAARAIPDLVAWQGVLPTAEWVAARYGKGLRMAQKYVKTAREIRGEH